MINHPFPYPYEFMPVHGGLRQDNFLRDFRYPPQPYFHNYGPNYMPPFPYGMPHPHSYPQYPSWPYYMPHHPANHIPIPPQHAISSPNIK